MCLKVGASFILLIATLLGALRYFGQNDPILRGAVPWTVRAERFTLENIPDLDNKVVIVTGANSGLGKSSAKILAMSGAEVVMGCRSMKRCEEAMKEIDSELKTEGKVKKGKLVPMEIELSSLKSVKKFAEAFLKKYKKLDSLMLNAGVAHLPYSLSEDGIESQFAINHVGHFYLTKLLLPILKKSEPSTITVVASNAHFMTYPEGILLTLKDLNDDTKYEPITAYGQSKLANVLFAQELAEILKGQGSKIYVNSLNPGSVDTDALRHWGPTFQKWQKRILGTFPNKIFFTSDYAALTQVYTSVSPEIMQKKISGKYFVPIADEGDVSEFAKNKTLQKDLWKFTEELLAAKGY